MEETQTPQIVDLTSSLCSRVAANGDVFDRIVESDRKNIKCDVSLSGINWIESTVVRSDQGRWNSISGTTPANVCLALLATNDGTGSSSFWRPYTNSMVSSRDVHETGTTSLVSSPSDVQIPITVVDRTSNSVAVSPVNSAAALTNLAPSGSSCYDPLSSAYSTASSTSTSPDFWLFHSSPSQSTAPGGLENDTGRVLPRPPKIAGLRLQPSKPAVVCRVAGSKSLIVPVTSTETDRQSIDRSTVKETIEVAKWYPESCEPDRQSIDRLTVKETIEIAKWYPELCDDYKPTDTTIKMDWNDADSTATEKDIADRRGNLEAPPSCSDVKSCFQYDRSHEYEMYVHRFLPSTSQSSENGTRRVLPSLSSGSFRWDSTTSDRSLPAGGEDDPTSTTSVYAELMPVSLAEASSASGRTISTSLTQLCSVLGVADVKSKPENYTSDDWRPLTVTSLPSMVADTSGESTPRRRKESGKSKRDECPKISRKTTTHPGCTTIRYNRSVACPDEDLRKYCCTVAGCGKAYKKKSHLKTHSLLHGGEKRYRCTVASCTKTFYRDDELRRHTRTHNGERPYECPLCDLRFQRSDHLLLHRRSMHGGSGTREQVRGGGPARPPGRPSNSRRGSGNPRSTTSRRARC